MDKWSFYITLQFLWYYATVPLILRYSPFDITLQSIWYYTTVPFILRYSPFDITLHSLWYYATVHLILRFIPFDITLQSLWYYATVPLILRYNPFNITLQSLWYCATVPLIHNELYRLLWVHNLGVNFKNLKYSKYGIKPNPVILSCYHKLQSSRWFIWDLNTFQTSDKILEYHDYWIPCIGLGNIWTWKPSNTSNKREGDGQFLRPSLFKFVTSSLNFTHKYMRKPDLCGYIL